MYICAARMQTAAKRLKRMLQPYVMVIDTETSGLPSKRNANPSDFHVYDTCRMVQVAWGIYTNDGNLVSEECYMVRPDDFIIPNEVIRIHGITNEEAMENGLLINDVLNKLHAALGTVQTIVAHNIKFDEGVVVSELYRANAVAIANTWLSKARDCTMLMGSEPGKKWCKLVDLYQKLFECEPEGTLHRADVDVRACARVYFELKKRMMT
jgi:DNA polymerase-3 subunit alpha